VNLFESANRLVDELLGLTHLEGSQYARRKIKNRRDRQDHHDLAQERLRTERAQDRDGDRKSAGQYRRRA
jgi:hypothetical protein